MNGDSGLTPREWNEGKVDRAGEHMRLFYRHKYLPVAMVAKVVRNTFMVEFLPVPKLDKSEYERIKQEVIRELNYYLVQKPETDPWRYAIWHCSPASNLYSKVHWGYYPGDDVVKSVSIHSAPVLALWAAIVAQRLGFDENEGLSLGRAAAGRNAQAKGRRLGIFKPHEEQPEKARAMELGEHFRIELCGQAVPAMNTEEGVRGVRDSKIIKPDAVRTYLEHKFDYALGAARKAMQQLAKSYERKELVEQAFGLYEHFRPEIPLGARGWRAKGKLDLGLIEGLTRKRD